MMRTRLCDRDERAELLRSIDAGRDRADQHRAAGDSRRRLEGVAALDGDRDRDEVTDGRESERQIAAVMIAMRDDRRR